MSAARELSVWILVVAGTAVIVLSALAAIVLPHAIERLHLLTVTTSLGAPLIGVALMIRQGWTAATAMIALIVVVLAVTGPVMSAATARMTAQRHGLVDQDSPP